APARPPKAGEIHQSQPDPRDKGHEPVPRQGVHVHPHPAVPPAGPLRDGPSAPPAPAPASPPAPAAPSPSPNFSPAPSPAPLPPASKLTSASASAACNWIQRQTLVMPRTSPAIRKERV